MDVSTESLHIHVLNFENIIRLMTYAHFHVLDDVLNAQPHFETYPDRSPVLRDQEVVLEVKTGPLLLRVFFKHPIFRNAS